MSQPMDWTTLPLQDGGRSLVEASAGTGKTWTIAVLYLRLLLEEKLSPRQIIVSTFTNAAAAELRERLRGKLLWALAEANQHQQGIASDAGKHADRDWIRKRWRDQPAALDADVQRLQAALAEFDAAPISTLHALCSRILADHPFAAGALFRGREMIDGKTLEAALVADLWRVIAQGDEADELVALARAAGITLNSLKKYVPVLLQADVEVGCLDLNALRGRLGFLGDLDAWASRVRGLLDDDCWFHQRSALRQTWRSLVDVIVPLPGVVPGEIDLAKLKAAKALTAISKAGVANPDIQALANVSGDIAAVFSDEEWDRAGSIPLRQFLAVAQHWCRATLQARLDAANQSSFDQLLVTVRDALAPRDGQRVLADALFAAWPVALVDEFQDTDPVQFGILDAIYSDEDSAQRGRLVMIGDPKQAIYRFRGGDVATYERAKALVPDADRLTLGTNHRSSRGYVEAVNQFYANTRAELGPQQSATSIRYQRVAPSGRRDGQPLRAAHDNTPVSRPLMLHRLAADDAAPDLEAHALRVCAGQIAWALSEDGYSIGEDRLQPGDIAVLLPSNAQIVKLAVMLKARGVPCVTGSQKSVFDTAIARELRLVLHAALHPEDPRTLRAALATRLIGASLGTLQALRHDAAAWDSHASRFHVLHATLERGGPLALVAALLEQHAARLLDTAEGERILTDLRHLGELLQEAWDEGGGERLLAWFAEQMADGAEGSDAVDARALRLESDAARVKLMTLHASKGLEFGVVFLPLMWKHGRSKIAERKPHVLASADGSVKYLVEGPAKDIVKQQESEERHRILYVALTRAIHACHVFVLPTGDVLADAIRSASAKDVALNDLELSVFPTDEANCIHVVDGWDPHPDLVWLGGGEVAEARSARPLPAAPPGPLPMRHSFTTLGGGGRHRLGFEDSAAEDEAQTEQFAAEQTDAAEVTAAPIIEATRHPELDALAGVAGADFGNAVHALFEHRVPGQPIAPHTVLAALHEHGVRPREGELDALAAPLTRRLQKVLEAPLADGGGPRLCDLAATDMRAELEFNYHLDGVSLRALRKACEAHGEPGLVPVREQTLAGLMNGKIDLVFAHGGRFHVLDYKGNQLAAGPQGCLQDYAPEALETKMLATGYRLQALLYTVAVERYLRERLGKDYRRDQHLGDCWYLFIRAVGLRLPDGTPCGVWRHRFDDGLLDAVQGVLGLDLEEAA
ncbi:UvrD-helicase domain-containing protein [Thermomonas sp. RSS23]|uniref:RecBCD enzyme subunit RecB n=1 Tax=Thermomonas beijingensis TaxID=2872701 RepID=A0ABS7TBZ7_9GAMM|nr:UvrD-helicase domain-containing protein [Thermomonas beijingensis]MBZ4185360.1 UvrD-helicase domain-containing protein [Thermomonas beijingensis]